MRGNAARGLLPALVVLALVAIVAIASTGSTPAGTDDARPPAEALMDTILSLGMLMLVPAAIIFVYGLMQRKAIQREVASGRYRRNDLAGFFFFMALLCGLAYWKFRDWERVVVEGEFGDRAFPGSPRPPETTTTETNTYEPEFAWIPVLVVIGLAAVGIAAAVFALRRKSPAASDEDGMAAAIAAVLDDTLDDLRAEKDPRRAIIAAYARLERVCAAHRLPRRLHETPEEYLARIGPELEIGQGPLRRLTDLFTWAKFSAHEVDAGMKEEAIDALSEVRDELEVAEARRLEEHMRKLRAAAESA